MKTPLTIHALRHALDTAARRAEMTGRARRARTLAAHSTKIESIDPIYFQMGGQDAYLSRVRQIVSKARRSLRAE